MAAACSTQEHSSVGLAKHRGCQPHAMPLNGLAESIRQCSQEDPSSVFHKGEALDIPDAQEDRIHIR